MFDIFAFLLLGGAALRRLQPGQPHRGGPAPRDRDRDGARRAAAAKLARRPLLLGAQIALAGVVLGVAVGLSPPTRGSRRAPQTCCPLPVVQTPFEPQVFLRGARSACLSRSSPLRCRCWRGCACLRSKRSGSAAGPRRGSGMARAWAPAAPSRRQPGAHCRRATCCDAAAHRHDPLGIGAVVTVVVAFRHRGLLLATATAAPPRPRAPSRPAGRRTRRLPFDPLVHRRGRRARRVTAGRRDPAAVVPGRLVARATAASTSRWRRSARAAALAAHGRGRHAADAARPGLVIARRAADDP